MQLSHTVGRCERLLQTPVPLAYARHTSRFASAWTLTLPLALVGSLRWLTPPVVFIVTWALFGILDLGHTIEDPFANTLELTPICEAIFYDCARELPVERWATHRDGKPAASSDSEADADVASTGTAAEEAAAADDLATAAAGVLAPECGESSERGESSKRGDRGASSASVQRSVGKGPPVRVVNVRRAASSVSVRAPFCVRRARRAR
mmetsp:Transcript_125848/g.280734  ORF Transcript_125848/g.280734 Transcript_125848/m.280734 type:complete len:208 (+) Transcript_125848:46-669(+)